MSRSVPLSVSRGLVTIPRCVGTARICSLDDRDATRRLQLRAQPRYRVRPRAGQAARPLRGAPLRDMPRPANRFVIEGMVDNAGEFEAAGITYYPYMDTKGQKGEGRGFSKRSPSAPRSSSPTSFPALCGQLVAAAARKLAVRLEQVDSNGLLPFARPNWSLPTHYAFRPNVHSPRAPRPTPTCAPASSLPRSLESEARWPRANFPSYSALRVSLYSPSITVLRAHRCAGDGRSARSCASSCAHLRPLNDDRNPTNQQGTSELSPYLHFGHLGPRGSVPKLSRVRV